MEKITPKATHDNDDDIDGRVMDEGQCKTEKRYYVAGIEQPPFTTHQTKYIFSMTSTSQAEGSSSRGGTLSSQSFTPHSSLRPPGSARVWPGGKPVLPPVTPQRGVSSREALKQSISCEWENHSRRGSRVWKVNFMDVVKLDQLVIF